MDSESLLVTTSFAFAIVLFGIAVIKGPRLRMLHNNHVFFDKKRLPLYFAFLGTVAITSLPVGYMFTGSTSIMYEYAGLNAFLTAIYGANFILWRYRDKQ